MDVTGVVRELVEIALAVIIVLTVAQFTTVVGDSGTEVVFTEVVASVFETSVFVQLGATTSAVLTSVVAPRVVVVAAVAEVVFRGIAADSLVSLTMVENSLFVLLVDVGTVEVVSSFAALRVIPVPGIEVIFSDVASDVVLVSPLVVETLVLVLRVFVGTVEVVA